MRLTRPVLWVKAARKEFEAFPDEAKLVIVRSLTIAAEGGMADNAKPFKGAGSGVFEIALKHRGDAFRMVYAVPMDECLWVIDAFQKKSKRGIKTPLMDVDRIKERLKRLREALQ